MDGMPHPRHSMPLAKILRRDIAAVLAEVERASGPVARNRLRTTLSTFFAFAIAVGSVRPIRSPGRIRRASTRGIEC
jgi:hypothetical protein